MQYISWTVSDLTAYLSAKLEDDAQLQKIWLEGEISNWKRASSGHIYFVLKDERSTIRCVMWRSDALRMPRRAQFDGELVRLHGRVGVYGASGTYQLYVDQLRSVGQGNLQKRFEHLKQQLSQEGMFEASHKQALPAYPRIIGVVTSPTGAAVQDVLNVLHRRYPMASVIVSPTLVQGDLAAPQIIAALQRLIGQVDVIILT